MRKYGCYHQLNDGDRSSTWILIQLQDRAQRVIERYHTTNELSMQESCLASHPIEIHLKLFELCNMGWRSFVCHLGKEIDLLVNSRCFHTDLSG